MEHPVPVGLKHLGMNIEAGVAQLCYFLGQQLNAVDRVAEDDGLIDLKLQKENGKSFIWSNITLHAKRIIGLALATGTHAPKIFDGVGEQC